MVKSCNKILLLCIFALLVSAPSAYADNSISNGAMNADGTPCNGQNKENCRPGKPVNGYNRGCNPEEHCRTGNP